MTTVLRDPEHVEFSRSARTMFSCVSDGFLRSLDDLGLSALASKVSITVPGSISSNDFILFNTGARVRMSSVTLPDPNSAAKSVLSDEEKQARLSAEIEKSEKLAASQLQMAEWFLSEGKNDIAKRRLQLLVETLPRSEAAKKARKMLQEL